MADKYMYWLDGIEGLGKSAKMNLLRAFGSAREVYFAREKLINCILEERKQDLFWKARKEKNIEQDFAGVCSAGIQFISFDEEEFPERLKSIPDAPLGIYYKGRLPKEWIPSVAIIGARECSDYGAFIANELGKLLGEYGIQVISGMAKGIDGISQSAALEAGGSSFGVLGCGVDVCYPKSNKKLYEWLQKEGGILSIYPPGTQPMAKLFPPRNRIVSGLADVLVVIEARQKSGTSITVEMALEQGRDIFAVPGRVTDRLSDGCNKMIKDGAHVFLSPQDFLEDLKQLLPWKMEQLLLIGQRAEYLNGAGIMTDAEEDKSEGTLELESDVVMKALQAVLDFYPQPVEKLAQLVETRYGLVVEQKELTSKLMYMCLLGLAKQESSGWFSKG